MMPPARTQSLVERLERALVVAAYIVVRHGPVYAPLVDRLERELEAARRDDPVDRARRILERFSIPAEPSAGAAPGQPWKPELLTRRSSNEVQTWTPSVEKFTR